MKRNLFWKFVFVVFLVAWALWEMYPPTPRNLLNEFTERAINRDATFTNIVQQARELEEANPDRTFGNLREAIGNEPITPYFPYIQVQAKKDPTLAVLHRLQMDTAGRIRLGLDLQGGTEFLVGFATNRFEEFVSDDALEASGHRERMLSQAVEVLRKRVDRFGVAEPILQPMGDDRILIQLPGLSEADKESAKAQIQRAAFLEFRMVHPESSDLIKQGLIPAGYEVLQMQRTYRDGREELTSYLVRRAGRKAEQNLTGKYVRRAYVTADHMTGMPNIALSFDRDGAILFGRITQENVGRQLAIVLDGEIYSAPVIRVPILDGNAVIEGDFTMTEAIELANILQNPLEAPLELLSERSVEPSLGKDNIRSGVIAAIVGAITVSIFMLVYYLFAGVAANIALALNVIILMGVMASVGSTLTLPGIAGIVLTIGMAVDANVLIYERIREELRKGKSLRGAVTAGYDRAFGTILDSNITTLIASVILVFLGTGPVKGFGVTLTIGIAASMFTALVVTRMLFDFALEKGWIKSLRMLSVIGDTSIDFMRFAKPAFIMSWVLIFIGIGWGLHRGKGALGPDFVGGDNLIMAVSQTIDVDQYRDRVRETVQQTGVRDAMVQFQSELATGQRTLRVTTPFGMGGDAAKALQEQFPEAGFRQIELQAIGPTVGREILRSALVACMLAMFGILVYVALRFEFSFAVGAVLAVAHDVLMVAGVYVLVGREFNATVVAAMLTIMGFSINDTIVIFDRIREDLKLGLRGSFREIINFALNQTLSRTIITSGTTLLATLALYLFGGGAINDFAFTFLIGVIAGCYSSIYIASALVLWWHKGERPRASTQVVIDTAETARA
jgi:SecD/SecF fusion protein